MSTQFLDVPGGRIAYEVTGPAQGPLVVLVHGTGDTRKTFRFLAPELAAAGYRVAAMDVRGYGESSTGWSDYLAASVGDDAVALVRHLGGPAVVIGHSIASASAVWAAAKAPQDVSGVVQISTSTGDASLNAMMRLAARLVAMRPSFWGFYYKSLYPTAKPADFGPYVKDLTHGLSKRGRLTPLRRQIDEMLAGVHAPFGEVSRPNLIIMGSKDKDVPDPAKEAAMVAERLAGPATVTIIPEAGHDPHAEMPEATTKAVLAFLQQVTGLPQATGR
jgi:pimeloyl-ACP methyl ester carboxylesterase